MGRVVVGLAKMADDMVFLATHLGEPKVLWFSPSCVPAGQRLVLKSVNGTNEMKNFSENERMFKQSKVKQPV